MIAMFPYQKEITFLVMCITWILLGWGLNKDCKLPLFSSVIIFIFGMVMGMGLMNWNNW